MSSFVTNDQHSEDDRQPDGVQSPSLIPPTRNHDQTGQPDTVLTENENSDSQSSVAMPDASSETPETDNKRDSGSTLIGQWSDTDGRERAASSQTIIEPDDFSDESEEMGETISTPIHNRVGDAGCGQETSTKPPDTFVDVDLNGVDYDMSTGDYIPQLGSACRSEPANMNNAAPPSGRMNSYCSFSSLSSMGTIDWSVKSDPIADGENYGQQDHSRSPVPNKNTFKQNKLPILTLIGGLFSKKSRNSSNTSTGKLDVVASTTGLILQDRPEGLPAKNAQEMRKHVEEYNRLIESIKRRELASERSRAVASERRMEQEERVHRLVEIWRREILPNWSTICRTQRVRRIWWEGVPSAVRGEVWRLAIGNVLGINPDLYDMCLTRMHQRMSSHPGPHHAGSGPRHHQLTAATEEAVSVQLNAAPEPVSTGMAGARRLCPCRESPGNGEVGCPLCDSTLPMTNGSPRLGTGKTTTNPLSNDAGSESGHSGRRPTRSNSSRESANLQLIKLDVSRTFPNLGLFQRGGPYHDKLHDLLGAYACYRPDIGYVQGMSFLAAVLILVMNSAYDAFTCFANILDKPCHHAFYSMNELQFNVYIRTFDHLLGVHLPRLRAHLAESNLELNMFLFDWLFTLFSRTLPLESAFRVWDLFFRDGEVTLFRAGLGLLRLYEERLMASDFDQLAGFLTGQMPDTLTPDMLVTQMRAVGLHRNVMEETLNQVRSTYNYRVELEPTSGRTSSSGTSTRTSSVSDVVESPRPRGECQWQVVQQRQPEAGGVQGRYTEEEVP